MSTIANTQAPAKRTVKTPVAPKTSPKELGEVEAKVKAPVAKPETRFQQLRRTYSAIKCEATSLGGCRSWLLSGSEAIAKKDRLTPLQMNILKATVGDKNKANYEIFKAYVDVYRRGRTNYSPWYIVLTLNKYEAELQKQFKF